MITGHYKLDLAHDMDRLLALRLMEINAEERSYIRYHRPDWEVVTGQDMPSIPSSQTMESAITQKKDNITSPSADNARNNRKSEYTFNKKVYGFTSQRGNGNNFRNEAYRGVGILKASNSTQNIASRSNPAISSATGSTAIGSICFDDSFCANGLLDKIPGVLEFDYVSTSRPIIKAQVVSDHHLHTLLLINGVRGYMDGIPSAMRNISSKYPEILGREIYLDGAWITKKTLPSTSNDLKELWYDICHSDMNSTSPLKPQMKDYNTNSKNSLGMKTDRRLSPEKSIRDDATAVPQRNRSPQSGLNSSSSNVYSALNPSGLVSIMKPKSKFSPMDNYNSRMNTMITTDFGLISASSHWIFTLSNADYQLIHEEINQDEAMYFIESEAPIHRFVFRLKIRIHSPLPMMILQEGSTKSKRSDSIKNSIASPSNNTNRSGGKRYSQIETNVITRQGLTSTRNSIRPVRHSIVIDGTNAAGLTINSDASKAFISPRGIRSLPSTRRSSIVTPSSDIATESNNMASMKSPKINEAVSDESSNSIQVNHVSASNKDDHLDAESSESIASPIETHTNLFSSPLSPFASKGSSDTLLSPSSQSNSNKLRGKSLIGSVDSEKTTSILDICCVAYLKPMADDVKDVEKQNDDIGQYKHTGVHPLPHYKSNFPLELQFPSLKDSKVGTIAMKRTSNATAPSNGLTQSELKSDHKSEEMQQTASVSAKATHKKFYVRDDV